MMAITLSLFLFDNKARIHLVENQLKITALLSFSTFIFIVGLIDDLRGLRARTKILCQLAASVIVCALGYRINYIGFSEGLILYLGLFSWPLTILWIVGITNAVNLIDGLDGLAAGLSAVACGVMVVLSIHFEQMVMCVIMTCLLGALIGFLFFNFNPAKVFMGDCGSLFLGFTIASSSVMFAAKSHALVSLTLPILALGIPIFDTLFSIFRRFLERRSLFSPDFEHFHHKLLALGLKQRHIVIAAYLITLMAAGFGIFMIFTRSVQSIVIFICILILLVSAFRLLGMFKFNEMLATLKKKHTLTNHIRLERENFEKARLHFCRVQLQQV
jgi:UDP-GlcNAc:undecaprenyl-phosphate GlcNAc-1-phosphate transferase